MSDLKINASRLWKNLEQMATLTEPDRPWTRRSFTPLFLKGREWLQGAFAQADLSVRVDTGGNLIGRREGSSGNLAPILLGSHSDTVPSGGRFDGVLGVLCALEVAQTLAEQGHVLRHPLEVVDFLAEEPSEFGLSCVGSRAMAGLLTQGMLVMTRPDGMTLGEGIAYVGGDPLRLDEARRGAEATAAYLEVHIEQARSLESAKLPIGVVTGIAAIAREKVWIKGRTDHAGATSMHLRQDALVGAAGLIRGVWDKARAVSSEALPLVATVGWIENHPNAANAVPGAVELILEARCADDAVLERFLAVDLADVFAAIVAEGLTLERTRISTAEATKCNPAIVAAIEKAAASNGLSSKKLPSGAGHDGVFISKTGPIGMIFIPCLDGLSHAPGEWAAADDCANAAQVMLDTVLHLDQG